MRHFKKLVTAACVSMLSVSGSALAQANYPDRPIQMIVAYSAGGGTDIAARTLAPFIGKYLNGTVTVVNKPGAGGEVGFTELAMAKPDGYTIGFINTPNLVTIPIQRQTRYQLESFTPVSNVVNDPGGVQVRPDSSINSVAELVEYAKANPNAVTYGTTGIGSDDHLAMLALERQTGIKMTHVPFPGSSAVRSALLGGHITLGVFNMGEAVMMLKEKQIRSLGQMGEGRWEMALDIPTFREQGFDIVQGSARGIATPAGVSDEIVQKLAEAVRKSIEDPEFQQKALEQSLPLDASGPKAFADMLYKTREGYIELWKAQPWVAK